MILEIKALVKEFQREEGSPLVALSYLDLEVEEGEFVCILGPSGCGKTTILRMIAGLDMPTSGVIKLNGKKIEKPGSDRGMVFQDFALFPWRTVRKNIEFGLELKNMPAKEKQVDLQQVHRPGRTEWL